MIAIIALLLAQATVPRVYYTAPGAGAKQRTQASKNADVVSVKDYGAVGDGVTDDTAAIQAAINAASQSAKRELLFPAATYKVSTLYTYYDAALNPGFNSSRNGVLTLRGEGVGSETGSIGGTILSCSSTTTNCLILGTAAAAPRNITIRDLTVSANTTGYVVDGTGLIEFFLTDAEVIQANSAGSGLKLTNDYFGEVGNSRFRMTSGGASTGDAITFAPTAFAGLFSLTRKTNIAGFAYGLHITAGNWQNLSIFSSEVQGSTQAIYVEAGATLDQLQLYDAYFEGACTNFIADAAGAQRIKNLLIHGMFSGSYQLTGAAISLAAPNSVVIEGVNAQDQYTAFLNITALPSGGKAGYSVNGANFPRTHGNAAAPFKLFTGIVPLLSGIDYATGDANTSLYDTAGTATQVRIDPARGLITTTLDNLTLNYGGNDPTISIGFSDTRKWSLYLATVNDTIGLFDWANSKMWWKLSNTGIITLAGVTFANLGTPANGSYTYCSDCTIANPCAGGGTGALAKRLNGVWVCN